MVKKKWGRIVYITSVSVKQPIPHILLSNTARAGLTGFMKTVAREIAQTGVTHQRRPARLARHGPRGADGAEPRGQRGDHLRGGHGRPPRRQSRCGCIGDPGDFGAVVAFLCSQQARFITGESVLVDGGSYAGLV